MANELADMEVLSQKEALRVQIDSELENALKELESLQAQLPKEQSQKLFEQCAQNALDAVIGHFGLAAAVLNSKDGGNVTTTHNVRRVDEFGKPDPIYASKAEAQRYENRGEYDSDKYHKDAAYKDINRKQGELKEKGQLTDYMTGEKLAPNAKTDLDHKVSAKTIHDDRARVLAEVDGVELANTRDNLAMTDSSLNRSKQDMTAEQFLARRDERIAELKRMEQKRGYLTDSELNEKRKLEKQKEINDEDFKKAYDESKEQIDKQIDKDYYTSAKPYKEAVLTGAKDAGKMMLHTAIGLILKDFIAGMAFEIKEIFKKFGDESFKDIFKRFAERLKKIWVNLREKWKDIITGSFEAGVVAFFSNLVVFVINIVFTTLKKVVQIIRAGFASLCQAVKTLFDKNIPEDERMNAAAKVFITGIIGAFAMLSSEFITKWLYTIPGLNAILVVPLPFLNETIGEALGLCISAALGAVLSTIAVYYMDKFTSKNKENKLQVQIMTKSGEVVNLKIMQTWFAFSDGFEYIAQEADSFGRSIAQTRQEIAKSGKSVDKELSSWEESLNELENLMKGK